MFSFVCYIIFFEPVLFMPQDKISFGFNHQIEEIIFRGGKPGKSGVVIIVK